jgi:hypothetical protein
MRIRKITPVHTDVQKSTIFLFYFLFFVFFAEETLGTLHFLRFTPRKNVHYMVTIKYLLSYNRLTIHITVRERRRE